MDTISSTVDKINQIFYKHDKSTVTSLPAKGGSSTAEDVRCSTTDQARSATLRAGVARSLTTYKEVVYNFEKYKEDYEKLSSNLQRSEYRQRVWRYLSEKKIVHYGLTQKQLELTEQKLDLQRKFLNLSILYDKITGNMIPLRDLIISPSHSPHRYHSEIQNRVHTLTEVAEQKGLVPLFMTITLPSQYHPFKLVDKKLVPNPKYDGTPPREAVKALTKRFARLRNDRALRDIGKDQRVYFRVNEPHQSGTPHTHILYYVPKDAVERVKKAFRRLYPQKGNDIQSGLRSAAAYVMKYINKTLPRSKAKRLSKKEKYLNAWYSHHRITRFSSSRTLAPMYLYRLLYSRYSLKALTRLVNNHRIRVFRPIDDLNKIAEIFEDEELIYMKNDNYTLEKHRADHHAVR